jgi:hypothetical protein
VKLLRNFTFIGVLGNAAVVGVAAATAFAADIDLAAIRARVDAQAAATAGGPDEVRTVLVKLPFFPLPLVVRRDPPAGVHATYVRLRKALARADRPGVVDDFDKLRRAAAASEGVLASDTVLADAVDAALAAGQAALAAMPAEIVALSAALESEHDRARCGVAAGAGRSLANRAVLDLSDGHRANCAALSRRAAAAYARGVALATRLLARQDARPASWSAPLSGLGGALLSVWVEPGPTPAVYTVGAADADGPIFLRCGGEGWVRLPVAPAGDLWWVTGVGDAVFACGTQGSVVRYDPAQGAVTDLSVGVADATLYGVWGAAKDDVWAVGRGAGGGPAIFRRDAASWSVPALPPAVGGRAFYKVWGTAADDVWFCGEAGLLVHWDGAAFSVVDSGTPESLFTVHGTSPEIAVGGTVQPTILERGALGWNLATLPQGSESLRGVFVPAHGDAFASGVGGTLLERTSGQWRRVTGMPQTAANDYHAVHVDDQGGVWVTAGDVISLKKGALLYHGTRTVPGAVFPQAKLRSRVQPVLYASCATTACHVGPFLSENLDLSTAEATFAAVGTQSRQSPLLRVLAGRPSQSYLWQKIHGSQLTVGGSGVRMPQGGAYLSQSDEDAVRAWILEGARDD